MITRSVLPGVSVSTQAAPEGQVFGRLTWLDRRVIPEGRMVVRRLSAFALAAMLGASAGADVVQLGDYNSALSFDPASPSGMTSWTVDGVQQLGQQSLWFRVGNDAAAPVSTLIQSAPKITDTNFDPQNDALAIKYTHSSFDLVTKYVLTGGAANSHTADIAEVFTITNTSATPLDLHFFTYVDLNLAGSVTNDSLQLTGATPNTAIQTATIGGMQWIANTPYTPTPSRWEAGTASALLAKLTNGTADDLSNIVGPVGPGDLAYVFQWDRVLSPGQSFIISVDKHVSAVAIPVPTAAWTGLALLGGLFAWRAHRKRQ